MQFRLSLRVLPGGGRRADVSTYLMCLLSAAMLWRLLLPGPRQPDASGEPEVLVEGVNGTVAL
eukprot:6791896-Alexandrium_andersonii.AAC.1